MSAAAGIRSAERRDVRVVTRDGISIALTHWSRGARELLLLAPGFWRVRLARENVFLATHLVRRGYDVATFDFRGHGESGGAYSLGIEEAEDVRAVVEELAGEGRRFRRLAVVGLSMGGAIAADALARWPHLPCRALAMISSPADVEKLRPKPWRRGALKQVHVGQAFRMPRLSRSGLSRGRPRAVEAVTGLTIPKLIITSEGDWLVDPSHGQLLASAASHPVEHVHLDAPGSLHADAIVKYAPRRIFRVLDRWLAENAPP